MNTKEFRSLYELTGDITDISTLLVQRSDVQEQKAAISVCAACGAPVGQLHMSTCTTRLWPFRVTSDEATPFGESNCQWVKDTDPETGDSYESGCGEKWAFIEGGPKENRVRFCHGCGKPVKPNL